MSEQQHEKPTHQYQRFLQSLPTDWQLKEIRELGTVVGGGTPSRNVPSFWSGSTPWITPGEVSGNAAKLLQGSKEHISASGLAGSGAKLLPPESLMVTTRATLGARAINAVPMATNQGFKSIIFKHEIDTQFYFHLFEKVQPEFVRRASGTTFLEISGAEFSSIEVPSPSSSEKNAITDILDTIDEAIQETEAILIKLKAVKQGLLHDLLTRGIDANGELRPPQSDAPHLYKKCRLGWIPNSWDVRSVSEIAEVRSGATPSRMKGNRYFTTAGIPWVKTLDLNEDFISETEESITAIAFREASCSLLPEGAVLVAMYGGWEQIGRTALLAMPAATNQAISALVFKSKNTIPEFVLRALQHGRARWQRVAASTRKDPNITKADVLAFEIVMPDPDEQARIACRFRTCLERVSAERDMLAKLRHQRMGLMDDLLSGRVRVTPLLETTAA